MTASINVGTGPTAIAVGVRVGVGGQQPRRDRLADRPADQHRHRDDPGRRRRRRDRGRRAARCGSPASTPARVSRIDPVTDTVTRTITVGNRPRGLAIAGGLVWVGARPAATGHRGGTLTVLATGLGRHRRPGPHAEPRDPVLPLTNDGLTAYQRVGGSGSVQLVPDLAVSLPTPTDGGTTYTFQLRRGIRYSNGELVRPEDFRRALERDLILGPEPATTAARSPTSSAAPRARRTRATATSPAGSSPTTPPNTVTFHLVAPEPRVPGPAHAPGRGRGAGRHTRPRHRPSPAARHRPVQVGRASPDTRRRSCATPTSTSGRTRRVPTATPTGSSSASSPARRPRSPPSSTAAPTTCSTECRQTAWPRCKPGSPASCTSPRDRHRRADPQHPGGAVQRRPGPPGDQLRDRPRQDRPPARPGRPAHLPDTARPAFPATDRYCPYTTRPQPGRDLARARTSPRPSA